MSRGLGRCYQGYYTSWASCIHCELQEHPLSKAYSSLKCQHTVLSPNVALNYSFQVMKTEGEKKHTVGTCRESQQSEIHPVLVRIGWAVLW